MNVYGDLQPIIGPKHPHTPESVAAEIVPKLEAEAERLAEYMTGHALSDEQRRVVEVEHRRLRSAIDRFEHAIELLNRFDPSGD